MQKTLLYLILLFLPLGPNFLKNHLPSPPAVSVSEQLYTDMDLENIIDFDAFSQALKGYFSLEAANKDIFTFIDFTKPSTQERLFVLDMKEKKILFSSHVAHGRNSGENYATSFSNVSGSHKSSLGFYITENTYQGGNGYSLVLNGLEKGINDKAKERAIVIHGADYCNPAFVRNGGRLGRSFGCPALPREVTKPIIDTIKNGTLLYIHGNDKK